MIYSILARRWHLPILSGIFIGTSYIPFPPWASLFCFVPLWIFWVRQDNLRSVVLGGWLTSFVLTLIGFNWVAYLLHEFAHLPWPVALLGMLLFAAIAHLFIPVAGAIWYLGKDHFKWNCKTSLGVMGLITVICEFYSPTLFDWNFGYSWYSGNLPLYHWAEIVGFAGLSSLTLVFNIAIFWIWEQPKTTLSKIILGVVVLVFLALNVTGIWLRDRLPQPDSSFSTLLVQANIGNEEKHAAELGRGFRAEILNTYQRVTDRGLASNDTPNIDFVVWPEAAFPSLLGPGYSKLESAKILRNYLAARNVSLVTGGYGVDSVTGLITNSLFTLNSQGHIVLPYYSKTRLLAFGEYIPGENYFPSIRDWLPPIGHYARGPGPTVLLQMNGFIMGPQICYESLFPSFSRGLADLGAQFIVNVTNDSWYGKWQEPFQHMYMTLARAVEFRRPVVRATNTGISTVALASGEIMQRSPLHKEWSGLYQVPYIKDPKPTFYQERFWLMPLILWSLLLMLVAAGFRDGRRQVRT